MAGTDIEQLIPKDIMDALFGANSPAAGNVFATMADLIPDTDTNIYNTDGTVGAGRTATLTDTLTFAGGATKRTYSAGGVTITEGSGLSPTGFGEKGQATYITATDRWGYGGIYEFGGELYVDHSVNGITNRDQARLFIGTNWGSLTADTYAQLYWNNGLAGPAYGQTGIQVNEYGTRLLEYSAALNRLDAVDSAAGMVFLSGSGGLGYFGNVSQTGFINWMGASWPTTPNLQQVMDVGSVATLLTTNVEIRKGTATNQGALLIQQDLVSLGALDASGVPVRSAGFSANKTGGAVEVAMTYSELPSTGGITMNEVDQVVRDDFNSKGLVYFGDYEAQFTARSLVTKQYVDGLVDNTIYNTDGAIPAATTRTATIADDSVLVFSAPTFGTILQLDGATGKVTIPGLLDPTGLKMTPVASNPGVSETLWSDSGDSNRPYWDANKIAFISDLDGNGIYGGSGSTPAATDVTVTLDGSMFFALTDPIDAFVVSNATGKSEICVRATTGPAVIQINAVTASQDAYIHFANAGTNEVTIGYDDSATKFVMGTTSLGAGVFYEYNFSNSQGRHAGQLGIGNAFPGTGTQFNVRALGTDETTDVMKLEDSTGADKVVVTADGRMKNQFVGPIDAGNAGRNHVLQWDADITERTGGDGYSVYQFTSSFAGVNVSNHFRTIYASAPTGGADPAAGRYAIYGDGYVSGSHGVGVYGRAGDNGSGTTHEFGGWFQLIGGLATSQNYGIYALLQNNASGSLTAESKGVYALNTSGQATVTGNIMGGHFWANRGGAATGVGTNIGLRAAATGGNVNYAFQVLANQGRVILGTTGAATNTFLTLRGENSLSTHWAARFSRANGVNLFNIRNDGLIQNNTTLSQLSGIGGAYPVRNYIGDFTSTSTTGLEYGLGSRMTFNPGSDGAVRGGSARFTALKQGAFEMRQLIGSYNEAMNLGSANFDTLAATDGIYGSYHHARNQYNGALTISNIIAIQADVTNQNTDNANPTVVTEMGGVDLSFNGAQNLTLTDMFGVKTNSQGGVSTNASITNFKALWISSYTLATNNFGVYQEGAAMSNRFAGDMVVGSLIQSAARSTLEVNGNAEVIGSSNGIILESPDGNRWQMKIDNSGSWTFTNLP